ncbi:MAG TPA: hypothetical protein VGQ83_25455 [Polyangia bacterium]
MMRTTVLLLTVAAMIGCGGSSTPAGGADAAVADDAAIQQDGAVPQDAALPADAPAGQDAWIAPGDHTDLMNGVGHKPGKEDPLANCVACHGADLKGGVGPSCYSCHNNDDHTTIRGGKKHKLGNASTCTVCHGPNNTGGLGPSCNGVGCH